MGAGVRAGQERSVQPSAHPHIPRGSLVLGAGWVRGITAEEGLHPVAVLREGLSTARGMGLCHGELIREGQVAGVVLVAEVRVECSSDKL